MKLVSLFAGIGGFDLGFDRAGFQTIGQCEIDPHALSVLERHWPDAQRHTDVSTLTGLQFGPADVVTFGSPCQDLSVAGKRAGLEGERSGLFLEAMRYIREMLEETNGQYPRAAVWENVPGAFSSNGGADFAAVLESMVGGTVRRPADGWANAGVAFGPEGAAEWRVLDSQHFGVAQRRRRVFVIYHPGGERAGQVLLERQSVRGNPQTSRSPGQDITGALTGGAGSSSAGNVDDNRAQAGFLIPEVMPTMRAGGANDTPSKGQVSGDTRDEYVIPVLNDQGGGGTNPMVAQCLTTGTGQRYDPETETLITAPVAFALRGREEGAVPEVTGNQASALRGASGGSSRDYVAFDLAQITSKHNRARAEPGLPAGTLTANSDPHVASGYAVRRLTPTECERLQGFPDGHTQYAADGTEIADTNRYRMLGNAVTVPVAEWIGRRTLTAQQEVEAAA